MEERIKNLEEKVKKLETIQYLTLLLNKSDNLKEILDLFLDKCIEFTGADTGSIMFKDEDSDELNFVNYRGFKKEKIDSIKIKIGEGLTGVVFKEGVPKIVNDVSLNPFYIPLREDIQSEVVVPLFCDNKIIGVLSLDSKKKDAFKEEDLQILITISNFVSLILNKIELYSELEDKIKLKDLLIDLISSLEKSFELDDIFDFIMKKMSENFGIARGMLVTFENEEFNVLSVKKAFNISEDEMQRGIYKVGEGIVGRVVKTGKPISIKNLHEEKEFLNRMQIKRSKNIPISFIAVPLKIEGVVIGVLAVEKKFEDEKTLKESEEILVILSNFIAGKIRNINFLIKERENLIEENVTLKQELYKNYSFNNIIGKNKKMMDIFKLVQSVADSMASILILGESGTGKELIAKAIHYASSRRDGPFVSINCASIPETLLESELFGYKKGAFTGAATDKKGKFQLANGGTLFLDEIGDMPLYLQAKILRALQEKEIEPLGSETKVKIDIRLISATNKPIDLWVKEGKFREDLFYRINVIEIKLPPLRERKDDIPILANYFVKKYAEKNNRKVRGFSEEALLILQNYKWPGNVRELENIVERAVLLCEGSEIGIEDLPDYLRTEEDLPELHISKWIEKIVNNPTYENRVYDFIIENIEKELISKALLKFDRNQLQTSDFLGINRNTLRSKIEKYGI
ncbi:MAG: sigma 54-interacting transcriptional regulator [Brevinematales bacterium]|nr:sigma 54-interacting transcriptional regulator [Brevinematales bacterium]